MKYTDIKTYEDACKAANIDPAQDLPYASPVNKKQIALNAFAKLDTIIAVINSDDAFPDFTNYNQVKYYPWFYMKKDDSQVSGFGFSYDGCDGWNADSYVGSRLCLNTSAKAEYVGKQFLSIYEELIIK